MAGVRSEVITVETGRRPSVRDVTAEAQRFVAEEADGLLHVFVPHATAGVAIIETGAGSDDDLLTAIDAVLLITTVVLVTAGTALFTRRDVTA